MILISRAAARRSLALATAWALGQLAGCGWTARDQYFQNQSVTVSSHPGDGSYLASEWKSGPGRQLHAAEVAHRFEPPN